MALIPALFLLFLTGVGPLIAWRRASWASLRRQFVVPAGAGLVTAVVLAIALPRPDRRDPAHDLEPVRLRRSAPSRRSTRAPSARARAAAASRVLQALGTLLRKNQRRYGGYIVHLGVVCVLLGIGGAAFNEERLENVDPGRRRCELDGYRLEYLTARRAARRSTTAAPSRASRSTTATGRSR